ncbi:MAG: rRNA maturation RNase YbeY [Bacteroidota bacterium]|jgi:rRNA maturation RNase YbeY
MSPIRFFYIEKTSVLRHRNKLKRFLESKAQNHGRVIDDLNIIFCSDEYLLSINKNFLQHDYYTDIITFELSDKDSPVIQAELYISLDRVIDNAHQLGVSIKQELHRVIFHGLLHLLGFKDKTIKDQQLMRSMEELFLRDYSFYV